MLVVLLAIALLVSLVFNFRQAKKRSYTGRAIQPASPSFVALRDQSWDAFELGMNLGKKGHTFHFKPINDRKLVVYRVASGGEAYIYATIVFDKAGKMQYTPEFITIKEESHE